MANRTRDIPIQFFVTSEEKKMIRKKMILSKTANMGAYLRKMAIDGIIINTDTTYLEKQFFEMHKIGVNVNQLARLASDDEMKDFAYISKKLDEISLAIDSLNLWVDKTAGEQGLNLDLLHAEKEKLKYSITRQKAMNHF